MRVKPHINALNMKRVLAAGQNPTRFALLKLREANRTLDHRGGCGGERESGKRFDDGGVETAASGDRGGGGRIGEEGHGGGGASSAVQAADMETARAVEVETRVEVKRDHEKDEEYDYDYGGEHDSGVYSEPGRIRKGSGCVSYWIRVS